MAADPHGYTENVIAVAPCFFRGSATRWMAASDIRKIKDDTPMTFRLRHKGAFSMNRTRTIIISNVVFLLCLLFGCSSKDPDRYYSKKDDFSIKPLKEWENKSDVMGCSVMTLSPLENATDQFRENVNVVVEKLPGQMALDEYFNASIANMKKLFTDFQENEKGNVSIDDTDAKWLIYSTRMGSLKLNNKVFFLVHDNRGYVITCSATPDGFPRFRKSFDEIAQSFQFE